MDERLYTPLGTLFEGPAPLYNKFLEIGYRS